MRHVIGVMLIAVSTVSVVLGQHHIYMKGSEVNANQGLFLAMPTNNFPSQTVGPLTVKVQAPTVGGPIGNYGSAGLLQLTQPDVPFWVGIWLINSGSVAMQGTLHVSVIDEWRAEPSGPILFEVAPKSWRRIEFQIKFGRGTLNAEYPVHAFVEFDYEGHHLTADPVLLLQPKLNNPPRAVVPVAWTPQAIPQNRAFALWRLPVHHQHFMSGEVFPFGVWPELTSTDAEPVEFGVRARRGAEKETLTVHLGALPPSNRHDVQVAEVEYPLSLPMVQPLKLELSVAVADSLAATGVNFRVRALPFEAPTPDGGRVLWERNVHALQWERADVDLGQFAGQKVRLQLETEGHANGEAFWAEPSVVAGTPPQEAVFPPNASQKYRVLGIAGGYEVRIWPGRRGVLDTVVGFVQDQKQLFFRGFGVQVLGDALQERSTVTELLESREEPAQGRYRVRHRFRNWGGSFDLLTEMWVDRGGFMARFWLENTPTARPWFNIHLEEVTTGPWSERATRIYAGQGNVIQDPKAFRIAYDAYAVGTSYAGFDFANGISLLQGADITPNALQVDPEARIYTENTALAPTITFLPAPTVWKAARLWRDRNGLRAAPGVPKLAGRFAFDLWDGRYIDTAATLERAFRYGLTDSVVVFHNWQHWGYDYRLPDIFPPNPDLGTFDEFLALVEVCRKHGVLFAPHDNYSDLYPQAEGFSYEHLVSFEAQGQPRSEWWNAAEQTRAYHVSPGRVRPLLERNLHLIRDAFRPTAYFIDVWASNGGSDYWTYDGEFRGRTLYQKDMADAFAWIRDYLGDNSPQISEGGVDGAVGVIDGSQAQHLRVDAKSDLDSFAWNIEAADAERIPWFDFAYHDRLAMHGAGYNERYYGGPNALAHGVYTDDYIATEVLTGHPAMGIESFGRGVVRKYWSLHDLMRALALRRMEYVEFVGDNIHRQKILWDGGGQVVVNRGESDWQVDGHTLPQYGFYASVKQRQSRVEAAVEKKGGKTAEWSRSEDITYVNGRGATTDFGAVETAGAARLTRDGDSLMVTALPDGGNFTLRLQWSQLPWNIPPPRLAEALDENRNVIGKENLVSSNGMVVLKYNGAVFAYRLR
jgi:hypothetical protein